MFRKSLLLSLSLGLVFVSNVASAGYTAVRGDLLRTADDATVVLVLDDNSRIPVSAEGFALRYNNNFGLVKTVTATERGTYDSNLVLGRMNSLANGTVFMYDLNQPGIYKIDNGFKRLFMTWSGFLSDGQNLNNVQWVGSHALYPTGSPVN